MFPPISFEMSRWYYCFLQLISLFILGLFSYQFSKSLGYLKTWFIVIASLSFHSYRDAIAIGQYGIIINVFLVGALWFLSNDKQILAGLFMALALTKPNISGLVIFILFFKGRYKALCTCCLYLVLTTIVISIQVKVNPYFMIKIILDKSKYFANQGFSGISILNRLGLPVNIAFLLLGFIGLIVFIMIMYSQKNKSLIIQFALAMVIARVFTYHFRYDDVMLYFLVLPILKISLQKPTIISILISTLTLSSLILPVYIWSVNIIKLIIWLFSLIYLLVFNLNTNDNKLVSDCLSIPKC